MSADKSSEFETTSGPRRRRPRKPRASTRSTLGGRALEGRAPEARGQIPLLFREGTEDLDEVARALLERRLASLIGERVRLVVTDNRHTMISSRSVDSGRESATLRVRVHHMFLDASDATVRALARYLKRSDVGSDNHLDDYIESNRHRISRDDTPPQRLKTRGQNHDLLEIYDELNARWFADKLRVRVTWARRAPQSRHRRRSVRLGTYVADDRLIRIHPVLDQPWVPRFFVAYVLFHEMLHAVVPAPVERGRQCFHGPAFRQLERSYPDYARALAWERANLRRLLTC
jgi:hypothetical protein